MLMKAITSLANRCLVSLNIWILLLKMVIGPANSAIATDGVWTKNATGTQNWSTAANWSSSSIADGIGATADFSTINITANRTVTLDSARTVGTMKFADATTLSHSYTIGGTFTLTLDVNSARR